MRVPWKELMMGYGTMSRSYLVWLPHLRQVKLMRSIYRLPESQRWNAETLGDIDVTVEDQTAPRGARAVPCRAEFQRSSSRLSLSCCGEPHGGWSCGSLTSTQA